jgi:hypothetical protein
VKPPKVSRSPAKAIVDAGDRSIDQFDSRDALLRQLARGAVHEFVAARATGHQASFFDGPRRAPRETN